MIKRLVQMLFCGIVIAIITGYIFKIKNNPIVGDRIIGVSILVLAFIVMPLFIFHRYRNKKIGRYLFPGKDSKKESDKAQ